MTKKIRTKQNNLRRYKSAIVYNAFGRSDLADMVKSWSFERIESSLGVYIEAKELYRVPKRERAKAATRASYYENFITHNVAGHSVSEAFKNRKSKSLPSKFGGGGVLDDSGFESLWGRMSRLTEWKKWSGKEKDMPRWLDAHAQLLNRIEQTAKDSRYGYGVMYYVYVEGWSEDAATSYLTPDKSSPLEYKINGPYRGPFHG
jgi:hypothetical protein